MSDEPVRPAPRPARLENPVLTRPTAARPRPERADEAAGRGAREPFFDHVKLLAMVLVVCGHFWEPLVRVPAGRPPSVTLSYAGDLVAIAWSETGPVGVDVEVAGPPVDGIDRREWTQAEASFKAGGDLRVEALALPEGYVGSVAGAGVTVRLAGPAVRAARGS